MNMVDMFNKNKKKKKAFGSLFYLLGAGIGGGAGRSAMPIISWL
jgi:hypothetical protein